MSDWDKSQVSIITCQIPSFAIKFTNSAYILSVYNKKQWLGNSKIILNYICTKITSH